MKESTLGSHSISPGVAERSYVLAMATRREFGKTILAASTGLLLPSTPLGEAGVPATPRLESAAKNIVLVHGAFADGSGCSKVIPLLENEGFNVTSVQNPLTSLQEDIATTRRILARQRGRSFSSATRTRASP